MKKSLLSAIAVFIFLIGCQQQEILACESPMIKIGGDCCLDNDNNSICDSLELGDYKLETEETNAYDYLTIAELEDGINKTYYPIKKYNFENVERSNLTGIDETFEMIEADRFYILKIKTEFNYNKEQDDFDDFVKRRYDLNVKNTQISANDWTDFNQLSDTGWKDAIYHYEHDLKKVKILDKDSFFETHLVMFDKGNSLLELWLDYKINVWCTPELTLDVYPSENWGFYYYLGSTIEANKEFINELMERERENMTITAEKVIKICRGEVEELKLKQGDIVFYGREGFYPESITIKSGDKITIFNENAKWEGVSFLLMRDSPRKTINIPVIAIGDKSEIIVDEPGNYSLFSVQYNPKINIEVSN